MYTLCCRHEVIHLQLLLQQEKENEPAWCCQISTGHLWQHFIERTQNRGKDLGLGIQATSGLASELISYATFIQMNKEILKLITLQKL